MRGPRGVRFARVGDVAVPTTRSSFSCVTVAKDIMCGTKVSTSATLTGRSVRSCLMLRIMMGRRGGSTT